MTASEMARRLGFRLRAPSRPSGEIPLRQLRAEVAAAHARWQQKQSVATLRKIQQPDNLI
jgi:hypothetical protein